MKRLSLIIVIIMMIFSCATKGPIQEHTVEREGQSSGVAGIYQEWADFNRNGELEPEELEELINAVRHLLTEPHDNLTPLDELADLNEDGTIDEDENIMLIRGLREPHPVENPFDERLDTNYNGDVELFEIVRAKRAGNLEGGVEQQELQDDYPERLFTFIDINHDKRISLPELREGRMLLINPHPVEPDRALDQKLDEDRDGFVAPHEIGIAAGVNGRQETCSSRIK